MVINVAVIVVAGICQRSASVAVNGVAIPLIAQGVTLRRGRRDSYFVSQFLVGHGKSHRLFGDGGSGRGKPLRVRERDIYISRDGTGNGDLRVACSCYRDTVLGLVKFTRFREQKTAVRVEYDGVYRAAYAALG